MKTVYLNGQFVSADVAHVSIFDRGFLYGDGLFETLRIQNGKLFQWSQHWARLLQGAEFLKIELVISPAMARAAAEELLQRNGMKDALLRVNLSRGAGTRGYSARGAKAPVLVMSLHDAPDSSAVRALRLKTSSLRVLKNDPLARIKSSNKLLQVMARNEAELGGFDEALLLNSDEEVAEATSGNFFWIEQGKLFSPPLNAGILPGITRATIFDLCQDLGLPCLEQSVRMNDLRRAEGAFLTLSSVGMMEIAGLDDLSFPGSPLFQKILQSYQQLIALETR